MHPSPSDASPALPAFVLALALLGVLAAVGGQVLGQMRMVPGTVLSAGAEAAVASPNNARSSSPYGASALPQAEAGPGWVTLTTPQKLALYPLAERWALISEAQKRRWLALAANFSSLPEDEQAKFHERMTDWANLSAQQRNQARLNYAVTNRLAPDDKRAQWEAYQALSEEERRALAALAFPKPKGAATALRPVSPKKLAQVPAATAANPARPNAPKIPPVTDHSPRAAAPVPFSITPAAPSAPSAPASGSSAVETAPVSVPVAVPAALPPLGSGPAEPAPPVTPDNSGLYPQ
ncbi:DUF3106 domain-containing protein [Acidovorax sp. sic0104]|uniref:DUF3106 domain-containing protein n=1 Tax=Acidovorax sp. sic0104 TaxID=2854784 RepID=UPI001C46392E|nr:DUF3106 domain-containing protein [Acidovorax sp. sic0104]MBV7541056.1 DUF3106 domain-containing protein [Acidovorax sp. sic0104]